MMELASFAELAKRYQVFFFDAFGVLKNSRGLLPETPDLLLWLQHTGKDVYVLTNDASRAPALLAAGYHHPTHGPLLSEAKAISSGMLAKEFLRAKVGRGQVAYLGKPTAAYYIESAGLEAIPISAVGSADEVQALALLDDEGFDWATDINRALNLLRAKPMPVVVANADAAYPVEGGDIAVAVGSLGRMMERILGRRFTYFGKPDSSMFGLAYATALSNNASLNKADCLMVGDTLETDIHGANAFGLDTLLVLSGNTLPARRDGLIEATGILPTYIAQSVFT